MDINAILTNFFAIGGATIFVCSLIVKLTPTTKDDTFLAKVINVFDALSVFNPNHVKVTPRPSPGSSSGA